MNPPKQTQQAGGGTSPSAQPSHNAIESFQANVLTSLREIFQESERPKSTDFPTYLKQMCSPESNAMLPLPSANLNLPLSSYFISSSHNTYLTGHQLYGSANIDGYKNVLLRGCRCVEIDCWNGGPDSEVDPKSVQKENEKNSVVEPVVLHGYTATKEVTFRNVCEAIRDYAFTTTDLPLIVSLEVHTNQEQQKMMVDIMNECFDGRLCHPNDGESLESLADLNLPSPNQIRNKILIKVKYSPPSANAASSVEEKPIQSNLSRDESIDSSSIEEIAAPEEKSKTKKSKIIEALGQLGLYTRSFHFSSLSQPEASVPTHVFSLSESTLIGVYKEDPEGLFDHNKKYLMRAYPKGTRIASSNLDPSLFWRTGVQMVALNWQKVDKGMMLQEAMFNGTGGWAQKSTSYMTNSAYKDSRSHLNSGRSWLRISIIAGQNIPMPPSVDSEDKLKPYVKCEVHVEIPEEEKEEKHFRKSSKDPKFKKSMNAAKGRHPLFGKKQEMMFEDLPPLRPELSFLRFKVMHDRLGPDEFVAWACIRLDRLATGHRFIYLWDYKGMPSEGVLLAKIDYRWNTGTNTVVSGR